MDKNILSLVNLIPTIGVPDSYEKMQKNAINIHQMQNDVYCAREIVCKMFNDEGTEIICANISNPFESKLRQNGFDVKVQKVEGDEENPWDMKWVTVKWPQADNVPHLVAGGASLPTRQADLEFVRNNQTIEESFDYRKSQ